VKSVYKDDGYLQRLEKDKLWQATFEQAVENIHTIIDIEPKGGGALKC
jgi:hypothetical protein